jgi:hypothetical protein
MRNEQLEVKKGKKKRRKDRCIESEQKYGEGSESERHMWIYSLLSFQ